jgi:sugar phosphate isomerase/epimerase
MDNNDKAGRDRELSRADFLKSALWLPFGGMAAGRVAAAEVAATPSPRGPVKISAFIKLLQAMPPTELTNFLADTGFDGVEATVRAQGYVLPENVTEQLPRFADALDKRGLKIHTITTDIVSTATPHAEAILRTAEKLGIRRYRLGFLKYDLARPVAPQLDMQRVSIAALAAMNKAYNITGVYQNHGGSNFVGAALWDYYQLIRSIPPEQMSFVYDTYHAVSAGGSMWEQTLNLVSSHLGFVSVKDFKWVNRAIVGVPLGEGEVPPQMFSALRKVYAGDYSLAIEYLENAGLEANKKSFAQDLPKLRKLLAG